LALEEGSDQVHHVSGARLGGKPDAALNTERQKKWER
jgi:hypothetical protein